MRYLLIFYQAPSPPHIHIPPTPEDQPILLPHAEIFIGDQANNEVLKIITNGYYAPRPTEWRYEWRRQAQRILSFLYLGPSSASKNVEFLKQEGITMLLCIRDSKSASANFLSGEKVAKQLGIEASHVDVTDNQDLTHRLRDAVLIINDHLISQFQKRRVSRREEDSRGKVLVFCESGNERSATVAVAYLLAMFEVDLVGAIQYIQGQRFCVAFDDNLKNLLMSFQQMVEAEKMTLGARRQIQAPTHKTPAKRSRADMDADEYMDVYQADDEARFDGRRVFAPFMDSRNQTMNIME
jgi:protein tyrosine phosphatase (PTP) superfamily phosphohydrolase (DUF442 family)